MVQAHAVEPANTNRLENQLPVTAVSIVTQPHRRLPVIRGIAGCQLAAT